MEIDKNYSFQSREDILDFIKLLSDKLLPAFLELCSIKDPDDEEIKLKREYAQIIKKAMPVIDTLYSTLSEKLIQQAKDEAMNAKLKGEKGDTQMLDFYLRVKNSFQAALKEGLRDN